MGVRTRGLEIATDAKRQVADAVVRAEARGVVERWNEQRPGRLCPHNGGEISSNWIPARTSSPVRSVAARNSAPCAIR
jgi:hypothetical protein